MIDKDKIIKGLQCCSVRGMNTCELQGCPYYPERYDEWNRCTNHLTVDAITLLKEQEPIESINFGDKTEIMANLEGLTWDDWHMYHSDTEVQNIAKSAFDLLISLLKEQKAVVWCKDCKSYYANGGNCDQVLAEWFCADGDRKPE